MPGAKVVDAADDHHARLQGFRMACQIAGATGQGSQALSESGIKPLDVSGVNATTALGRFDERLDLQQFQI